MRLLDRLEPGDVLVVTKLDRLGRNAMDVGSTVARLAGLGVRVHCLALGGVDLASPTGRLTMGVINAVAEFERDLLVERTQAGLSRARAEGRRLGRPASLTLRPQMSQNTTLTLPERRTEGQTAVLLSISLSALRRLEREGQIKAFRPSPRKVLYLDTEIEAYVLGGGARRSTRSVGNRRQPSPPAAA